MNNAEKNLFSLFLLIIFLIAGFITFCQIDKNINNSETKQEKIVKKEKYRKKNKIKTKNIKTDNNLTTANTNQTILITPKFCDVKRDNPQKAVYCNMGAYSKYITNKEVDSGKYYYETRAITNSNGNSVHADIGIISDISEYKICSLSGYNHNGQCESVRVLKNKLRNIKNNDIIGIAIDFDEGLLFYSINGSWQNDVLKFSNKGKKYTPALHADNRMSWEANFGKKRFIYPMPNGYKAFDENSTYQQSANLAPNTYDRNKVVLVKPQYCSIENDKDNVAKYCNIGALSTYYTNKKVTSGKYYFEAQMHLASDAIPMFNNIGVISNTSEFSDFCSLGSPAHDGECSSAEALEHTTARNMNNHDIVSIAADFDNGFLFYAINGVWKETPKKFITQGRAYTPAFEVGRGSIWTVNFGTKKFRYPIPEGYKPYN